MPYYPYIETCCEILAERMEYPSDHDMISLVHIHRVVRKIQQSLPMEHLEAQWSLNTPVLMLIKTLAAEIQGVRDSLPQVAHTKCLSLSVEQIFSS